MKENMQIFLLNKGRYRGAIVEATEMVENMAKAHKTGILETYVLGESYIAASLLTSMLKGKDRLGLVIECGGPIKGINVEVTAAGNVRGFLKNNPIPLEKPQNNFDLNFLIGPGFLSIIKYPEGNKQSYKGQVMITYGDIAKDLANYFTNSENLPTAFNLSVKFDNQGKLLGAGGLFIQKMPDNDNFGEISDEEKDAEAARIEEALQKMPSLGLSIYEGNCLTKIINENFSEFFPTIIASRKIRFKCSCSRELFLSYLSGLSEDDKKEICESNEFPLITSCHNCNTDYSFSEKEIKSILCKKE